MRSFEPVIIAFCCRNCAYPAADLAGSMRLQYPTSIRIIEIACSGAIDQRSIMQLLEAGVDGIIVAGCLEGECRYKTGNGQARSRISALKDIIKQAGLAGERLVMYNISSSMALSFCDFINEYVHKIKNVGPSQLKADKEGNQH